ATRNRMSWSARLLIGLVLILAGAAAATWGLAHYRPAARFLGILPTAPPVTPKPVALTTAPAPQATPNLQPRAPENARIAELEDRLARVETATQRAEGSAGRADALVVAFAARCSACRRATSTRRWRRRCGCRARGTRATGSPRRGATSARTARSTRSNPPRSLPAAARSPEPLKTDLASDSLNANLRSARTAAVQLFCAKPL